MTLPANYAEKVYAGVLGKVIGVYLGRPFEGWTYEQITEKLGDINYYVHDRMGVPLVVTDDDITGTFTFIRAFEDYGHDPEITAKAMGHTWLNYLVEEETILWWGGMGNSTEHTAYLRLKAGVEPPASGSIALNGQVVAEQIGAQIFIDGWGMIAPGDPELAARMARQAASVSHDGEALYGAQVIAAMIALAFTEDDRDRMIDGALATIPADSLIATMISEIRDWHQQEDDWRKARHELDRCYGYDLYGGNCHMVPNHGLIMLSLLYGEDNFQKSLMIVNTAGWDTDCNSGNLGCLMGIRVGLEGLEQGPDFRGPVADRMFLPSADGGRAITDTLTESFRIINMGRTRMGEEPLNPKTGARFHFEQPGSVQGFVSEESVEADGVVQIENVAEHSEVGDRSLQISFDGLADGRVGRVETATFIPSQQVSSYFDRRGYRLLASPTIYPGQIISAGFGADTENSDSVEVSVYCKHYNAEDGLTSINSETIDLAPGCRGKIAWEVPFTNGYPIAQVGVQIAGTEGASGRIYLDFLTWSGTPDTHFNRPQEREFNRQIRLEGPIMWRKAWVDGFDSRARLSELDYWPEPYRLIQNVGRGLMIQGSRDWTDYQVTARLTPHMCKAGGVGARVQGMQRYYALLMSETQTQLVAAYEGKDRVLASVDSGWKLGHTYQLTLAVAGNRLTGWVDGEKVLEANDPDLLFSGGGIALIAEEGRIGCDHVAVGPVVTT